MPPQAAAYSPYLTAVAITGVRAIISPGWGGLDKAMIESAGANVLAVENVPHDWLFQWVSAVCHHGGAGTTAIGLKCGKPTIIVPFFGDQPWWAAQIASCGAGPPPVFPKNLTSSSLATAIRMAISPETRRAAVSMGEMINQERGAANGVESFHRHMPLLNMRCDLDSKRVAVWYYPKYNLRLSAFAAQVLADHGDLKLKRLKLHRPREHDTYESASDPVTGVISPSLRLVGDLGRGLAKLPTFRPDKGVKKILEASTFGSQAIIQGVTEGLYNTPKLYGSQVRTMGHVTGVGSGIAQGSKALVCGVYDGITDLVKEPVKGVKNGGLAGGVLGVAIGASNCVVKPFAGAMAAVSLPLQGTVKSLRAMGHKNVDVLRRATKTREGLVAFRNSSLEDRAFIIGAFHEHRKAAKRGKRKAT
ncbi:glycosyltransferase family 1 protein [Ceratobasidium sp. AG-Ba]|nr:glycosyltransferase family 1 protein [Ceratobasidium sp. AG-Ba]QRW11175.1 glycosyltransferase family 1 protein [Ceratobasidium sp. AG-Ba]